MQLVGLLLEHTRTRTPARVRPFQASCSKSNKDEIKGFASEGQLIESPSAAASSLEMKAIV